MKRWIKYGLLGLAAVLVLAIGSGLVVGCMFSGSVYQGEVMKHFDGKEFVNQEQGGARGLGAVLKWRMNHKHTTWEDRRSATEASTHPERVSDGSVRVVFVNHATFLLQVDGLNILTDPVWSERTSPVTWIGPQRWISPGLRFEDLPPIDLVLISHNHYDHMDLPTLVRLEKEHAPVFLVPLGNRELLVDNGLATVIDLDWWDYKVFGEALQVHFVPARHFSGRGLFDRNRTLWGGFVLESTGGPIYFVGDTGWGAHFQQVKDRFGAVRLAIIPIGAFRPEWFMGPMHISPKDAVRAHQLLEAKVSVPMHYGTFKLADDEQDEPLEELARAVVEAALGEEEFVVLQPGVAKESFK